MSDRSDDMLIVGISTFSRAVAKSLVVVNGNIC